MTALTADERALASDNEETVRPAPRRKRDWVLMGDIVAAPLGRPLLLWNWPRDEDEA